jgi:hypothetical protein
LRHHSPPSTKPTIYFLISPVRYPARSTRIPAHPLDGLFPAKLTTKRNQEGHTENIPPPRFDIVADDPADLLGPSVYLSISNRRPIVTNGIHV